MSHKGAYPAFRDGLPHPSVDLLGIALVTQPVLSRAVRHEYIGIEDFHNLPDRRHGGDTRIPRIIVAGFIRDVLVAPPPQAPDQAEQVKPRASLKPVSVT